MKMCSKSLVGLEREREVMGEFVCSGGQCSMCVPYSIF